MKAMIFPLAFLVLISCGGPTPRKPVEVRSGSFMKASVARNKEMLQQEEQLLKKLMEEDSLNEYLPTAAGSWYYYLQRNEEAAYTPRPGDEVQIRFNILSLSNDTIYSAESIGTLSYLVDKEDKDRIFPGLRNGIKLLKEGETATFLFPSSLAYGYPGDQEKIGPNIPIKSTVTLLEIKKQQDSIQNEHP